MNKSIKTASIALLAIFIAGMTSAAMAEAGQWKKSHPRRAEVNNRLANQSRRIHNEVKEGDITRQQGAELHKEDRQIRQQERQMAAQHNGHITKAEKKALNQEENSVSKEIGK